ncbi:hypothetical protein HanOQP8_Chr14g0542731 [Helianthus annuus]|nr:hypothetical protein HanOQP8_Chr14g0542731 [Helianthus annuus]
MPNFIIYLTLDKLDGGLGKKRVKRIVYAEKSIIRILGEDGPNPNEDQAASKNRTHVR